MYQRHAREMLSRLAKSYPIIGITGPRQSGKTTLAQQFFTDLPYVTLEDPDIRYQARQDPRGFLGNYPNGVILDEVQHVPDLLSYLQGIVDANEEPGRFVITGSQNFSLSNSISQSLAGRIGLVTLLPLSLAELGESVEWQDAVFKGGYPRLHKKSIFPNDFYPFYLRTYIDRDVRQLKNIEDLATFQRFIKLCAGRTGQIVNMSELALRAEVSVPTVKRWLSVLEASYIIFLVQPYYQNFNKRLVKAPKLYFYDTGLVCSLLGITHQDQLANHYHTGALFENLVITELLKHQLNKGMPSTFYFWRDYTGNEVDLVTDWGGILRAIEIKSGKTFRPDMLKGLDNFDGVAQQKSLKKFLIYNGQSHTFKDVKMLSLLDVHHACELS